MWTYEPHNLRLGLRQDRYFVRILKVENGVVHCSLIPGAGFQDVAFHEAEFRQNYRHVPGLRWFEADAAQGPGSNQHIGISGVLSFIWFGTGYLVGSYAPALTFLAVYVAAVASMGWLGVGLGWIPAWIVAKVVSVIVRPRWLLVIVVLFCVYLVVNSGH